MIRTFLLKGKVKFVKKNFYLIFLYKNHLRLAIFTKNEKEAVAFFESCCVRLASFALDKLFAIKF